ncbi:MAG: two-component system response regulator [Deltaproteobacteria bacterium HGW-Deltaproteobacteria-13]|jgi:putative nucleotidyltransferase with HDIG domain|nr:MAG: two-component system response regulator [Deltaproteobacteria bacterium HGW-Deltaproteobacteria-13]
MHVAGKDIELSKSLKYKHSILIVDDEDSILNAFKRMLADEEYDVHTVNNGLEGLYNLRTTKNPYSLIISDQRMPEMSGVQFFAQAKDLFPDAVRILLTGYADSGAIIDAINKGGVHLYFTKPWREEEVLLHIKQSLSKVEILAENKRLIELIKTKNKELMELNKTLEKKAHDRTNDLLAQTEKLKDSYKRSQLILDGIVKTLSKIVETRDPYTSGHEDQVAKIACRIAKEMKLTEDQVSSIHIAATLHDIGKISVPSEILTKPSILSNLEREIIKTHCKVANDILVNIEFPYPVAEIIYQHHERMDGSGYPRGLKGEDIALEARIIGVADVIDAMASYRPYRPALGVDAAIEEIVKFRGVTYDSSVVDACLKVYKQDAYFQV